MMLDRDFFYCEAGSVKEESIESVGTVERNDKVEALSFHCFKGTTGVSDRDVKYVSEEFVCLATDPCAEPGVLSFLSVALDEVCVFEFVD